MAVRGPRLLDLVGVSDVAVLDVAVVMRMSLNQAGFVASERSMPVRDV